MGLGRRRSVKLIPIPCSVSARQGPFLSSTHRSLGQPPTKMSIQPQASTCGLKLFVWGMVPRLLGLLFGSGAVSMVIRRREHGSSRLFFKFRLHCRSTATCTMHVAASAVLIRGPTLAASSSGSLDPCNGVL